MKIFTIHLRRDGLDPDRDIVVIKEGFSWPAFFFGILWALWNRLWIAGALLLATTAAVHLVSQSMITGRFGQTAVTLGLAVIVGLIGNDLRRWTLDRADFRFAGIASGPNADEALRRFFDGDRAATEGVLP